MQSFAAFEQFVHTLVLTQFEQNVDVFCVFEEVLELANMLVFNAAMNLDFTHQLLLRTTLGQARFLDDFGSVDVVSLRVDELPAFGEPSLSQEFAFDVLADGVRVSIFVLLLDEHLCGCLLGVFSQSCCAG
jgi:hypothetical protein